MPATSEPTILRLATAGSVDDGKSTLIGRLLYDAKSVLADQLEHVADVSRRRGGEGTLDLSLLTDGLRAEREQGITIDVAYRYFATPLRRFILADTPGHVQYTRNMVTGASTADLAIVLVDARKGVVEQTKRHAFLARLLGIRHVVLAVNKMDLVGYEEEVFDAIVRSFWEAADRLDLHDVVAIPTSALLGHNVVERSPEMPWYTGPSLLEHLETVDVVAGAPPELRLPVQLVLRGEDYRGHAGRVESGRVSVGDEVVVLPAGTRTSVAAIDTWDGQLESADAGRSVTLRFADDVDASRGDMVCHPPDAPEPRRDLEAQVCWLGEAPLRAGARYALKAGTSTVRAVIDEVGERLDVDSLTPRPGPAELGLNDIGSVRLRTSRPLVTDAYAVNRATGAFILIDEGTNETVGAGMVS